MMKEFKVEDINPLAALKNNLWQALNLLRGFVDTNDYHFVLFLLMLQRKGVLKEIAHSNQENLKQQLDMALQKLGGDTGENLRAIYPLYDPTIKKANTDVVYELIRFLASLDQAVLEEHFAAIFDDLLYGLSKWQGRAAGEFILPMELSRFICTLADLPPHAQIYNPFAGVASFGVLLPGETLYLGQEKNFMTWAIGLMRLMAYDKEKMSVFSCSDSTDEWGMLLSPPLDVPEDENYHKIVNHDLVIASPPFGAPLSKVHNGRFGIIRTYEHFLIEKGIEVLKENGKLIAIISQGFLFRSGTQQNLRQYLVENDLLEMVISFPGGLLMNTGVQVSVLVLNMNKQQKGSVRFVDAKKYVDTSSAREKKLNDYLLHSAIKGLKENENIKVVANETIKSFEYNLSVSRYFQKEYKGVPLADLGSLIRGQRISEGQKGKFVRIRDLKDNALDYQLNLSSIEDADLPRPAQKITESCLLLASRWKTLKPTYFNYTGTPIYISPDTLAFKVDESKCDVVYLINELHAGYVAEQLDSYRIGDVIPMIRREDLLSIIISLPGLEEQSLEHQRASVKQRLVALAEEKKKELNLFSKIHGLEAEIVEQNTYLRHTLAGPSSNLKDSISNIKKIILDKVAPTHPDLLDLKISDKHLVSLREYLEIIERDATKIVSAVTSQLKVDTGINAKKLSPIEIIGFLDKYAVENNERSDLNFKIEFEFDKEVFIDENGERIKTFILANDDLLRDLFDNLIDNAVKHAFSPDSNNRIEIYLMKNTENEDRDEVQVLFSNTGKPFPDEFTISDFTRKGSKFGSNAGDGFGGWYINEIIKKLSGEFDIIDETGGEGLPDTDLATSFEINFPIIETEEDV